MSKYSLVAMGGTFDIIHKGHIALLSKSFQISDNVIIGLTGDEFTRKKGKNTINDYQTRLINLTSIITNHFSNSSFQISKLNNDFGPAVLEQKVQALVVSDETFYQGKILNELREKRNLSPVDVIVVPMIMANDGKRVSTTRIKKSEIDVEGNLLSVDK